MKYKWIYYYLLYNRDLRIVPVPTDNYEIWEKTYKSEDIDHVFCLQANCDYFADLNNSKVLWTPQQWKQATIVQLSKSH